MPDAVSSVVHALVYHGSVLALIAYWAIGVMLLWHDGLPAVTGVARWGPGGGGFGLAMVILAAALAATAIWRRRRAGARRSELAVALAGACLMAATPPLLEAVGAAHAVRQTRVSSSVDDRLRYARHASLARSSAARWSLRSMLDSRDPYVQFEAAYGLALLDRGSKDPRAREVLAAGADALHDAEDRFEIRVDAVLLAQLWAFVHDEWPTKQALPRPAWRTTEDFRSDWRDVRPRFEPAGPLLEDALLSLPGSDAPALGVCATRLTAEDEDALRAAGQDAAHAIGRALQARHSPERRARLARLGRAIWNARVR